MRRRPARAWRSVDGPRIGAPVLPSSAQILRGCEDHDTQNHSVQPLAVTAGAHDRPPLGSSGCFLTSRLCQAPGLMEAIKPGGTAMVAPRKYPEELRERPIRMTLEARQDPAARSGTCRRIGEQLGINPETLRGWGEPGRDRCWWPAGGDDGGGGAAGRAGARGPGAAPGERDPALGVGFLRGGAVRHEALSDRGRVRDLFRRAVAAAW